MGINKLKPGRRKPEPASSDGNSFRGTILIVVLLAAVGMIFVGLKRLGRASNRVVTIQKPASPDTSPANAAPEAERPKAAADSQSHPVATGSVRSTAAALNSAQIESQELIKRLTQIDLKGPSVTHEQASAWKHNLQQLIQRGPAAVPAISEFLKRNVDVDFRSIPGGNYFASGSVRHGLFDALRQIGGPEAIDVTRETLRTTADPTEVALLSRSLERLAPGQYREEELNAARDVLNQSLKGKLPERADMAPLFELLQAYGNESIVQDLINTVPQWHQYATFALAGLPEGIGIPALIRLAQDPEFNAVGKDNFALLPLAQVATQYPEAATALVEQARSNAIPQSAWGPVAIALSGTHWSYGNAIFGRTAPTPRLANEEINRRVSLIDQILAVNKNPEGVRALGQARETLMAKLR